MIGPMVNVAATEPGDGPTRLVSFVFLGVGTLDVPLQ